MNRHPRAEIGAYVLGALEPAERHTVESHLTDCSDCRDEVARLSAIRPLLDRLTAEEAADDRLIPPADLGARISLAATSSAATLRRQVRHWRLATAAATAAAGVMGAVMWSPWETGPDIVVASVAPVDPDAAATAGTVAAQARAWGTTLELELQELPVRETYVVWAVADDGSREQAGAWGPTSHRRARVGGATAIQRDHLRSVEITDIAGTVLVDADFAG